ncbi:hypothetical protein ACOSQ2_020828 [Xanthoceras sorbifolium]
MEKKIEQSKGTRKQSSNRRRRRESCGPVERREEEERKKKEVTAAEEEGRNCAGKEQWPRWRKEEEERKKEKRKRMRKFGQAKEKKKRSLGTLASFQSKENNFQTHGLPFRFRSDQLSAVRPGRYIPIVCGKLRGDSPLTPGGVESVESVTHYMHATQHSAHRQ